MGTVHWVAGVATWTLLKSNQPNLAVIFHQLIQAHRMVRENIQTALILEDDADWDISLKKQLYEFAKGSRALQFNETTSQSTPLSPYGDDWDILWLGHCEASNLWDQDGKYYIIPDDPTVPPREHMRGGGPNRSAPSLSANRTRMIFESVGGRCTAAYALSARGARTLLYIQSLTVAHSIDRGLSRMCSSKKLLFKCISPWPALIGGFRDKGDTSKDSDRVSVKGTVREVAETDNVQYSVRLNVERLVLGKGPYKPQWPQSQSGETWGDVTDDLVIPEGHLEFLTKDQFVPPPN